MNAQQKQLAYIKLRDIQDTPLTVIVAMFIAQKPVGKKYLVTRLRRSYNTISDTIDFLESGEYIERVNYRAWQLPGGQIPLPGFETIALAPSPQLLEGKVVVLETSKFDVSAQVAIPETSNFDVSGKPQFLKHQNDVSKHHFDVSASPTTTTTYDNDNNKANPALKKTLLGAGIGLNQLPGLTALSWITPEYVAAHTRARREGRGPYSDPRKRNVGFQIHCMQSCDPAPGDPDRPKRPAKIIVGPCNLIINELPCTGCGLAHCETCDLKGETNENN